jgi:hypothetical protein
MANNRPDSEEKQDFQGECRGHAPEPDRFLAVERHLMNTDVVRSSPSTGATTSPDVAMIRFDQAASNSRPVTLLMMSSVARTCPWADRLAAKKGRRTFQSSKGKLTAGVPK